MAIAPGLKRLACMLPYGRRVHDGLIAMRQRIDELEGELARLKPGPAPEAPVYWIDQSWRDAEGVYVNGWAHAGSARVDGVALVAGELRAETRDLAPRPDVSNYHPNLPETGGAGFTLYLACPVEAPIMLEVATPGGLLTTALRLPAPAKAAEPPDASGAVERFLQSMRDRRGTVLELGARQVGSLTTEWRSRFEPVCTYIGNDIHPGPNIDLVGDVHALTRHVTPGSIDGIFSIAVVEHLAAPWLAAAEMNRSLKLGGELLHVTHQTWPVHELPNDFFRMSDQALISLFGPSHGFEVIECGMACPVMIYPSAQLRFSAYLTIPLSRGYAQSFIHARKVTELNETGFLLDGRQMEALSQAYPKPAP